MKLNLEKTTIRDLSYLINTNCLRADSRFTLEEIAKIICASDRYKAYLEDDQGKLCGVIQAKQIAVELLKVSVAKENVQEMLPTVSFILNSKKAEDLAQQPIVVKLNTSLNDALDLMDQNHIREVAVIDDDEKLLGTIEAKKILSYYLQEKAEQQLI